MFGARNAPVNHTYEPTITLRQSEDEFLCPVWLIKEYIAKTKYREEWDDKLFITRKMGLTVAVSNATTASKLKETLTLANIRASGVSTRKTVTSFGTTHEASIRTIMEAGDLAHTSTMYGYYIRCLPREVQIRILEHWSACKEWMWQQWPQTTCIKLISVQGRRIYFPCLYGISLSLVMNGSLERRGSQFDLVVKLRTIIFVLDLIENSLSQNVYFSHFVEIWPL